LSNGGPSGLWRRWRARNLDPAWEQGEYLAVDSRLAGFEHNWFIGGDHKKYIDERIVHQGGNSQISKIAYISMRYLALEFPYQITYTCVVKFNPKE